MLSLVRQKISGAVIQLSTSAFRTISLLHAVQTYHYSKERACDSHKDFTRFPLAVQLLKRNHRQCLIIWPLVLKARKMRNKQGKRTSFIARSVLSHRRTYGENFPNDVTNFEITWFWW